MPKALKIQALERVRIIHSCLAVIGIVVFQTTTVIFVGTLIIVGSVFYLIRTVKKYELKVLFSREIFGTNVKEHEFVFTNRRTTFAHRTTNVPRLKTSSFTGGSKRTKPPTSAIVYLKTENGEVIYIDGLTNAQTDIYEIGDTLYKFPGTKYPIVLGREAKIQPCPICGTANRDTEEKCITCGLEITE